MTIAASAVRADVSAYIATGTDRLGATHFGTIDLTTGVYTDIGNMGRLLSGLGAFGNGLYGGLNGGNTVYQVNPGTGQLTPFSTSGATPVGGWNDFGSTTTGLYGLDSIGNLYSINPSTAVVTFIGAAFPNLSAGPSTTIPSGQFWGLAQLSPTAVPEPGYLFAIGVTLFGIGVTARRRANLNRIVNYPKLLFRW
ncbi:MAG TPA: hypothetical protein VG096_03995 [Bryobacteraceae bacterium]|jgi:hypothetical protein|nr:hypothetical protein [Bryobacteraceae bacterium]